MLSQYQVGCLTHSCKAKMSASAVGNATECILVTEIDNDEKIACKMIRICIER